MPSAGRTSMPSTLPATPSIFQVLVIAFLPVSTMAMVLSPVSAATSAACADTEPMMAAADAARMVLNCIDTLPWIRKSPDCDMGDTGQTPRLDAGGRTK